MMKMMKKMTVILTVTQEARMKIQLLVAPQLGFSFVLAFVFKLGQI